MGCHMLSDLAARKAAARDKAYKLSDAKGLYLFVSQTGSKVWRMDYRVAGKRRTATIGPYPVISLSDARRACSDMREELIKGLDPVVEREARKSAVLVEQGNTFGTIADDFLARLRERNPAEATMVRWERILGKTCLELRQKPIRLITSADVLALLNRLAGTGRRETAHRVRSSISAVFRHAISTLRAEIDPTYILKGAVAAPVVKHMAAITDEGELGLLMTAIDESTGWWSVKAYLRFLALTFVRPGEARLATWEEIDFEEAVWRIPAGRMKKRRPHEVPLSRQAIDLLRGCRAADPYSPLIFPSLRSNRKPLSDNAANSALRKIGYSRDQMVSHGFRSSASTILNRRKFDREVIEMQLAHCPEDRIRSIYNRDKMWSDRVRLMQRWADMLEDFQML